MTSRRLFLFCWEGDNNDEGINGAFIVNIMKFIH